MKFQLSKSLRTLQILFHIYYDRPTNDTNSRINMITSGTPVELPREIGAITNKLSQLLIIYIFNI